MVKSKLIMKKPKKPMNAMEAYRKKQKDKEKHKHKKDRFENREVRQKGDEERKHPSGLIHKHNDDDDDDGGFEGQEDLMDFDPEAVQQILQQKQRMREKRYDEPVATKASIQDLYQTFSKKPVPTQPTMQANPQSTRPEQPTRPQGPSNISSFMGDNILRSHNAMQRDPMDPHKPILPVAGPQNTQMQPSVISKTAIGDKRTQKRDNAGSMDPFMMTTLQGDYDPTQRNKNKQQEAAPQANPLLANYVSQAPGVYKAVNQQVAAPPKPVNTGPTVIVKSAALTTAPLRSQMEKEKSSLVPVNVLKKKAPKPENEEGSRPNQSTLNIGIQNVTNVPAPRTNFGFSQNIQQNIGQNDQLSAFLSEISKLDES